MATTRNSPTRADTFIVRLSLNGKDTGIWDKKTGGESDSSELKYQPGGMVPPLSLGGQRQIGNLTLQREYDRVDDHDKINAFLNATGSGKCVVTQRPLDFEGNPYGRSVIWNGTLKKVQVPDVDSEGGTTAAMIEVEITVTGFPVAA